MEEDAEMDVAPAGQAERSSPAPELEESAEGVGVAPSLEPGELDEDETLRWKPSVMSFSRDFSHYAKSAVNYLEMDMPDPVAIPNADLPSGDAQRKAQPADPRYPTATSFDTALSRALEAGGGNFFGKTKNQQVPVPQGTGEAAKVPLWFELAQEGVPRPEPAIASHLLNKPVMIERDKKNRPKIIGFERNQEKGGVMEDSRAFADVIARMSAQNGALASSVSLLCSAIERLARFGAGGHMDENKVWQPPGGLTPEDCIGIHDMARLASKALLSIGMNSGEMVAASIYHTRRLWLELVDLKKVKGQSVRSLASRPIDVKGKTPWGLFGPSVIKTLQDHGELLEMKPAYDKLLPTRRSSPARERAGTSRDARDRSPQRRDRSERGGGSDSRGRERERARERDGGKRKFELPGNRKEADDEGDQAQKGAPKPFVRPDFSRKKRNNKKK